VAGAGRHGDASLSPGTLAAIFAVAAATRLAIALAAPEIAGDTEIYRAVADNIRLNGCVSLSDPAGGACVPHWGGNQLPGYPAFVAAVHRLSGGSDAWVRAAQCLPVALATAYAAQCTAWLARNRSAGLAAGLLLAASPLTLPWPRFLLTEALTLATTLLVLAECVRSLAEKRFRALPLGLALAAAAFVRYDSVALLVPVLATAFLTAPPRRAVAGLLAAGAVAALPLGLWWARSVWSGAGPVPEIATMKDGSPAPAGYIAWGNAWTVHQYQYPAWNYPVYGNRYSQIRPGPEAFASPAEEARVRRLLEELRSYEGRPMPAHIDAAFADLARAHRRALGLAGGLRVHAERLLHLWVNPRNSAGWPVSVGPTGETGALALLRAHPQAAAVKAGTALYRAALPVLAAALLLWAWRARPPLPPHVRQLLAIALAYAAIKSALLAGLALVESRYLLSTTVFLEAAIAVALCRLWQERRRHA